jgi:phospholipase/carboxylesterase
MTAGAIKLSGPAYGPARGAPPKNLVIFLHGYGADGNDLIGLAPHWASLLPEAEFLSPHAPFPCELFFGRQWFAFEGRTPGMILAETRTAAAILNDYIDAELARRDLSEDRLALVGFSQGAMLALFVALRRARAVEAVVGYSGALIGPETLAAELRARPRVLLVHGDSDPVVPYPSHSLAVEALREAGVPVTAETRRGLQHAIDDRGLSLGGRFIADGFRAAAMVPS